MVRTNRKLPCARVRDVVSSLRIEFKRARKRNAAYEAVSIQFGREKRALQMLMAKHGWDGPVDASDVEGKTHGCQILTDAQEQTIVGALAYASMKYQGLPPARWRSLPPHSILRRRISSECIGRVRSARSGRIY